MPTYNPPDEITPVVIQRIEEIMRSSIQSNNRSSRLALLIAVVSFLISAGSFAWSVYIYYDSNAAQRKQLELMQGQLSELRRINGR